MNLFLCIECGQKFNSFEEVKKHRVYKHKIKAKESYVSYLLNNIHPLCKCGCGSPTQYVSTKEGFREYKTGHNSMVVGINNFHIHPESKLKSAKTQSENWKKGMYRRWWDENTEETRSKIESIKNKLRNDKVRGDKISKSLSGRPKTEESKIKLSITQKKRYKNNPELISILSKARIKYLKKKSVKHHSQLEKKFMGILKDLKIDFIFQYELDKKLFDFYIPNKNILIEVDGDFFHCNPKNHPESKYQCQKLSLKNDNKKNIICQSHNIPLLRYWEYDIINHTNLVIEDIKHHVFS